MNNEHLAKEADRLQNDPIFTEALKAIRDDALEALAGADVNNPTAILRLQQRVLAVDEIRLMLSRFILNAGQVEQGEASPYA